MNAQLKPAVSIETLENATVDPDSFNHEAHVYAAWLFLDRWPLHVATSRFCDAIRRLTTKLGAQAKYHETITCFFMQLINERRMSDSGSSWLQFRSQNSDLIDDAGKMLRRYYSKDLLDSELARQHFLLPNNLAKTNS
jgi:hypothetical protein